MSIDDTFEQYRLIVEETAKLRDGRHNVSNLFLSVNAIFVGAAAVLLQQITTATHPVPLYVILLPMLLVFGGLVLCFYWRKLLHNYSSLLGFRFQYLTALEATYQDKLIPVITDQTKYLRDKNIPGFTSVELRIPVVFIVMYLAIIVGVIVVGATMFGPGMLSNISNLLPH